MSDTKLVMNILWVLVVVLGVARLANTLFSLSLSIPLLVAAVAFALIHGAIRYRWSGVVTFPGHLSDRQQYPGKYEYSDRFSIRSLSLHRSGHSSKARSGAAGRWSALLLHWLSRLGAFDRPHWGSPPQRKLVHDLCRPFYRCVFHGHVGSGLGSNILDHPTPLDLGARRRLLRRAAHELSGVVFHRVCVLPVVCALPPFSQGCS